MLRCILYTTLLSLCTFSVRATNYYISPTGSDSATGTSTATAWRTIAKVNATTFAAGDQVLFQGGKTFNGNIYLSPSIHGITIKSYDTGIATINAGNSFGLYGYNTSGITISNINFVGSGDSINISSGISFYTDTPGNVILTTFSIDNVKISGFHLQGITFGAWPGDNSRSGYNNISITNCKVHDNGDAGISIYGYYKTTDTLYSIKNVHIKDCYTYNNRGLAGATHNSGNGIVIGQVDSATIEYCESYNNGERNNYTSGPAGIWAWDSKRVIIQHCESHHNHSTTTDGDGFDLDGGTRYSIMQYNYSHDNDGAGFLVCQFAGARSNDHNVVRYNISENDASKGNNGGIFLYTPTPADSMHHLDIYNNTIYTDTVGVNSKRAFYLLGPSMKNIRVANNIFMAMGNYLLDVHDTAGILIVNNAYNDSGGIYSYLGVDYDSLTAFRTSTGQEMLDSIPKGIVVGNNFLWNPGLAGTLGNPHNYNNLYFNYFPRWLSPVIDSGLDLHSLWGIDMGKFDYLDWNVPWVGYTWPPKYDIGACEWWIEAVPQINANDKFNIYPNPATDKIVIETSVSHVHFILYNIEGTKLYQGYTTDTKTELDLQPYPKGNYLLQLSTKEWTETKKLVKY